MFGPLKQTVLVGVTLIMASHAKGQEKKEPLLWTPRYLASGEVALPERVLRSDLIVSGRVVAQEPNDAETVLSAELPYKVDYRIAVMKVKEVLRGPKDVKDVRLGFLSPDQDRKIDKDGKAIPPISPYFFQAFAVGQDGLFFLRKHHKGEFCETFQPFGGFYDSANGPSFATTVEDVRRLNKVLEAPLEALKADNATNRFVAATMLVRRYRLSWLKDRKHPEKAIDAEESKLLLKTLAEADWSDANEAIASTKYPPHPYRVFLELRVKKSDGYEPPVNPPDVRDTLRYTQTWLRDNQEKYRIQQFVIGK